MEPEQLVWTDPPSGTAFAVPAGGSFVIKFTVENEARRPRLYAFQCVGLPDGWVDEQSLQERVAPQGEATFEIRVRPPSTTSSRQVRFKLQLAVDQVLDDGFDERSYALAVTGLPVQPEPMAPVLVPDTPAVPDAPEPVEEPKTEPQPIAEPIQASPLTAEPPAVALKASATPVQDEPTPKKTKPTPKPSIPAPQPAPTVAQAPVTPPITPTVEPISSPAPVKEEPPKKVIAAPKLQAPIAPPTPPPAKEPEPIVEPEPEPEPILIDLKKPSPDQKDESAHQEADFSEYDFVLTVGGEVPTLRLAPGQTALLRFPFSNSQKKQTTYVIEEDYSLPVGWLKLVAQAMNLPSGTSGELSSSVSVPLGTKPNTYQFQLRVGPQGAPLSPYDVMLVVEPDLCVKVSVDKPMTVTGPGNRDADFALVVSNCGNADTAYRLQVTEIGETGKPEPVYETSDWRYLLDTEVENLKSTASNRPSVPQNHKLIIRRKGIWWRFGWVEKHQVKVYAAPVTARNEKVTDQNSVDLTLKRWRILPMPWFVCAGIGIVLLPILGSGVSDFTISNGLKADAEINDGKTIYYVMDSSYHQDAKSSIEVRASYVAPFYARLSLDRSGTKIAGRDGLIRDLVDVPGEKYESEAFTYSVGPIVGSKEQKMVRAVPFRTSKQLQLLTSSGDVMLPTKVSTITLDDPKNPLKCLEYTLHVSGVNSAKSIVLHNLTQGLNKRTIQAWTLHWPDGFDKSVRNINFNPVLTTGVSLEPAKFLCNDLEAAVKDTRGWTLVTTDADCPILRIRFAFDGGSDTVTGTKPKAQDVKPIVNVPPNPAIVKPTTSQPDNISKSDKDSEPKKSILNAIRPATAQRLKLNDLKYNVVGGGSLLVLNDYAVLVAPVADKPEAVCGIAKKSGGSWVLVEEGPQSQMASMKQRHPEVPSVLFAH